MIKKWVVSLMRKCRDRRKYAQITQYYAGVEWAERQYEKGLTEEEVKRQCCTPPDAFDQGALSVLPKKHGATRIKPLHPDNNDIY